MPCFSRCLSPPGDQCYELCSMVYRPEGGLRQVNREVPGLCGNARLSHSYTGLTHYNAKGPVNSYHQIILKGYG